jgi:hypothetical protein
MLVVIACLLSSFHATAQLNEGLKVVLIRHGEKPDEGSDLSCQGVNRAKALPAVLKAKFGLPGIIFVPRLKGDTTKHARMYQTISPFSDQYHLPLNTDYKVNDVDGVSRKILKQQGTVLVVWEHNGLEEIAQELGVKEKLKWKGSDFDSIWIITFSKKGKARLAVDAERLHPSPKCN